MLITKNRKQVQDEVSLYASDDNVKAVGMLGFQLEATEAMSFIPEDFLRKAAIYYKQFMDKIVIHFNLQISPLPEDRGSVKDFVPKKEIAFNNQTLIDYLQTNFGDVIDIMYFDTPTVAELIKFRDQLLNPTAITAANYKGPSMAKMPYWGRYINTYFPVQSKLFGIVPKTDLTSASTGRITMNHLWRNGVSMCFSENQVPDYGRMVISPHYRNFNGETGSLVQLTESLKFCRAELMDELSKIDTSNLQDFNPDAFVSTMETRTSGHQVSYDWRFADFNRMIRTKDYIPKIGCLEIIFFGLNNEGQERWHRECLMIGCDENKFFDLDNEVDFSGSPTSLEDLKNNFSVSILDSNYNLPTSLTTEAIEPIKVF